MPYIIYLLFFTIAIKLLPSVSFIKRSELPPRTISILLSLKILTGAFLGWITIKYYPGNDYWSLHNESITEWKLLKDHPRSFFENILYSPYTNKYGGFFDAVGSYWNDLRNNIIVKMLAFFNLVSMGNFYINSLLLNVIGFFGHVALYRIFQQLYPEQKKALIIGCFLIPTTLYFSSGIHKDLIVFTSLAIYAYQLYFSVQPRTTIKRITILLISFAVLVLMRNFVAMALLPATCIYLLIQKQQTRPWIAILGVFGSLLLMSMLLQYFLPALSPFTIIAQRQADFSQLAHAQSQIELSALKPNINSYLMQLPNAINHGFLRPYVWETKNVFSFLLSIELLLMECVLVLMLFQKRKQRQWDAFIYFGLALGMVMLLINGYIIPNTSSLVRYRSLYLPFMLTPILCNLFTKLRPNT